MFSKLCCILFVFGGNGFDLLLCIVCEVIEGRFIHTRAVLVISRLFSGIGRFILEVNCSGFQPTFQISFIYLLFRCVFINVCRFYVHTVKYLGSFIIWFTAYFHVEFLVSVSSHKIHFVLLPLCPLTFSYLFFFNLNDFYLNVNVITRFALQDTNLMLPTCRWCFQN